MNRKIKTVLRFLIVSTVALVLLSSTVTLADEQWSVGNASVEDYTDDEYMQERLQYVFDQMPYSFIGADGESLTFGGATDCLGYARWAYYQLFGQLECYGANVPGKYHQYSVEDGTIHKVTTPQEIKNEFDQLDMKMGTMLCYEYSMGSTCQHSMLVLKYDNEGLYALHANWAGKGNILISFFTWDEMASIFGQPAIIRTPWDYPNEESVFVTAVTISGKSGVYAGTTAKYSASLLPYDASVKGVKWSVVNITGEASIDTNGVLTAVKPGAVTVVAAARDGSGIIAEKTVKIADSSEIINPIYQIMDEETVFLRWDKSIYCDGYLVYRSDASADEYSLIYVCTSADENHLSDTVTRGGSYSYKICSYKLVDETLVYGQMSDAISVTARFYPNLEQTAFAVKNISDGFIITNPF